MLAIDEDNDYDDADMRDWYICFRQDKDNNEVFLIVWILFVRFLCLSYVY